MALASPLSSLPKRELSPLWQTIRRSLSFQPEQDFAHSVLAFAAVIHALGGREALIETIASMAGNKCLLT